jgi:hypothetical protein
MGRARGRHTKDESNISKKRQLVTTNLKVKVPLALKMVFSNPFYIAISVAVFVFFDSA